MVDTMVRNLLSNSIKFTGKNGYINITSQETIAEIELSFQDSGVGMTPDQIRNLDENRKIYSTYGTMGEKGIGLGLQIVREFAHANKGRLTFKGEPGKGCVFNIYLPKSTGSDHVLTIPKAEDFCPETIRFRDDQVVLLRGKRLLIVDDYEGTRNFLKLLLSDTFEIFEATNGKEGLEMAKDIQPDMIITDLMMPVMSGLEFCSAIKNDYNTSHIPIILISGTSPESGQLPSFEARIFT
jgi:CheY-like chemotaxis protein